MLGRCWRLTRLPASCQAASPSASSCPRGAGLGPEPPPHPPCCHGLQAPRDSVSPCPLPVVSRASWGGEALLGQVEQLWGLLWPVTPPLPWDPSHRPPRPQPPILTHPARSTAVRVPATRVPPVPAGGAGRWPGPAAAVLRGTGRPALGVWGPRPRPGPIFRCWDRRLPEAQGPERRLRFLAEVRMERPFPPCPLPALSRTQASSTGWPPSGEPHGPHPGSLWPPGPTPSPSRPAFPCLPAHVAPQPVASPQDQCTGRGVASYPGGGAAQQAVSVTWEPEGTAPPPAGVWQRREARPGSARAPCCLSAASGNRRTWQPRCRWLC